MGSWRDSDAVLFEGCELLSTLHFLEKSAQKEGRVWKKFPKRGADLEEVPKKRGGFGRSSQKEGRIWGKVPKKRGRVWEK